MKYRLKITPNIQKELNQDMKRKTLISTIIGAVVLGLSMIFLGTDIVFELHFDEWVYIVYELALSVGLLLLACGVAVLMSINKVNQKAVSTNSYGEYELFEDCLIINSFVNGELINVGKVYYTEIIKIKETNNYIFLYPNKQIAYVIPKDIFSNDELLTIKMWVYTPYLKHHKIKKG